MPVPYQPTPWDQALFDILEQRTTVVGFDDRFDLPIRKRLWLEAADAGRDKIIVAVIRRLNMEPAEAQKFLFSLITVQETSGPEADHKFLQDIINYRKKP